MLTYFHEKGKRGKNSFFLGEKRGKGWAHRKGILVWTRREKKKTVCRPARRKGGRGKRGSARGGRVYCDEKGKGKIAMLRKKGEEKRRVRGRTLPERKEGKVAISKRASCNSKKGGVGILFFLKKRKREKNKRRGNQSSA